MSSWDDLEHGVMSWAIPDVDRHDVTLPPVQWFTGQPGDGWLYAAFVVALPTHADGGAPGEHVHVSVTSPVRWSYTFRRGGLLHERYVAEKMKACDLHPEIVSRWSADMTRFVGKVLGRETALFDRT